MSDSLRPHGPQPTRLVHPWDSPGKSTGVGCHCLLLQPVHPKGNQSWMFTGRTFSETETPILWPPDVKRWLIRKDPDAGKDGRHVKKGMKEDKMVGCHPQLNGCEFEQTPSNSEGLGTLVCCCPWGCKVLGMTQWLNNNNLYPYAGRNKMLCFLFRAFSFTNNAFKTLKKMHFIGPLFVGLNLRKNHHQKGLQEY